MSHKILAYIRQNAVAFLALFVALAGTSYAAISLPANSVGTKQLRNKSVTGKKLAKHSIGARALDPKSIAGHVADWARIGANGQVISSSPRASVFARDPQRGLIQVSWHRSIAGGCVAIANPANVAPLGPATATTAGPIGQGPSTYVVVETFNGRGDNVPEDVNILVICP